VSGLATPRTPLPLPAEAVFEAVLIDAALADAPARELGRMRRQTAGQAPYQFTIPFRDADLDPRGRYNFRATLRQGERLLLTSDTFSPVTPGRPGPPLSLSLVRVASSSLGGLPVSWGGDLLGGDGRVRWQLDLAADGTFQLRQEFLKRPAPHRYDDIGRWQLEPNIPRLGACRT
jgi:uncharacterized lipoprotein YbaY